jgi:hypothetical protein
MTEDRVKDMNKSVDISQMVRRPSLWGTPLDSINIKLQQNGYKVNYGKISESDFTNKSALAKESQLTKLDKGYVDMKGSHQSTYNVGSSRLDSI